MLISTKGRYALRVMAGPCPQWRGGIRCADGHCRAPEHIGKVSRRHRRRAQPLRFFADAARPRGRLPLARCPGGYAVGDILRVAEGSIAPVSCVKSGESECPNADNCLTLPLWKELDRVMNDYLESVTLADLINGQYCRKIDRFRGITRARKKAPWKKPIDNICL